MIGNISCSEKGDNVYIFQQDFGSSLSVYILIQLLHSFVVLNIQLEHTQLRFYSCENYCSYRDLAWSRSFEIIFNLFVGDLLKKLAWCGI
jgi:hypothetical protein